MYERILVALDGSPTSDRALAEAIGLARRLDAELVVAHVVDNGFIKYDVGYIDVGGFMELLREQGKQIVASGLDQAKKAGVRARTLLVDDPLASFDVGLAIDAAAREAGAQLLVLGTHGRRGVRRLLLGSVAESVARQSSLPVLLVRGVHAESAERVSEGVTHVVAA
ncbi:universal stress protein [Ralstonia solanacearum]|nr:universal stress protein [Ralstonia solanacearum]AMP71085.1 universal stress protein UspA [Ralstonia solanacearum]AMP75565.1 universal stress protein UspA [Ralstonia solanacearum]AYB60488.1 universal stress protein [Ralstonia solanacearum]MBB6587990.1 universal stress protein [Ralstonia solanacearum]MCG3576584.1 universal stress protein [Ralstonia solanacearum]